MRTHVKLNIHDSLATFNLARYFYQIKILVMVLVMMKMIVLMEVICVADQQCVSLGHHCVMEKVIVMIGKMNQYQFVVVSCSCLTVTNYSQ